MKPVSVWWQKTGEAPGTPVPLLLEPVFLDIPTRLSSEDSARWWKNDSAAAYQVQVSRDENAGQVMRQLRVNDPVFIPADNEVSGEYFLIVRPIDPNGLLGIPASASVDLVSIREKSETPILQVELLDSVAAITLDDAIGGVEQYEVQVSFDQDFSQVLSSDIREDNAVYVPLDAGTKLYARGRSVLPDFAVSAFGDAVSVSLPQAR